jgi:hypothetical protein
MRLTIVILALASAGLSACGGGDGGGGPRPTAGTLDVVMTNAPVVPGAVLITISGGQIDGVSSTFHMYETATATNSRKVLLTGLLTAGTLAQIQVPDIALADNYVVQVLQAAARSTAAVPYQNLGTNGFVIGVE